MQQGIQRKQRWDVPLIKSGALFIIGTERGLPLRAWPLMRSGFTFIRGWRLGHTLFIHFAFTSIKHN